MIHVKVKAGFAIATAVALFAAGNPASVAQPRTATSAPAPKPDCGTARYPKPGGGNYVCSFADNFNGTTLDKTKWVVQKTATSGFLTGDAPHDCYVDDPDNVSVSGGSARLTARVEASSFTCTSPYGDFTTNRTAGSVVSWGKFAQAYGRFEFRAKFPTTSAQGIHSALWLFPQDSAYGGWPNSGEVDVAEWFSRVADRVFPSVHYSGEDSALRTGYDCVVSPAGSAFHNYAVEWTSTVMKFYYDGAMCYSHSWTPTAPLTGAQPFDKPFVLAITQAFGHGWNAIDSTTPTTATTYVDWVRVWK